MQKSLLSLQPKSKPINFCPFTTLQTQYSTIDPQHSDIENVQLVSQDEFKVSSCKQQNQKLKQQSVHLEIQLDDGKIEMIFPKVNDDPIRLAKSFCEKHELDEEMLVILTENIKKTISKMKKNQQVKKQRRFVTEPTQYCTQQLHKKKCDTTKKDNVSHSTKSRDFGKKKELSKGQQNQQIQSHQISSQQNSKKSTIQYPQYTHSPQINSLSQKMFQIKPPYKSTKRQSKNPHDSVRTQSSFRTESFDDKEFKKAFKNKENQLQSVFDYLYEDSRVKEMKKKEKMQVFMKRNCNFRPEINATSRKIAGNRSFEQRLKTSVQKSSEKNLKNKSIMSSVSSSKGSLPKHYFKLENVKQKEKPTVTYSLKNLTKNNHSILSKPYINSSTKSIFSKPTHPSTQTQKLYEIQKQKAFRSIFCLLDDDRDGVISILNINLINGIEQKLIQILFPVLEELEILQTELNENEFCSAIDKLFSGLSVDEKGYMLKYCQRLQKEEKQRQQNEFAKPTMTPVSTVLVNQTERSQVTVYEYSKIREQLKQQKLQQQRILKERTLMRNCTFHPKTNPKKAIYF